MLSTVCSGEVTRNFLWYKEYICIDSMYHRRDLHVYFIRITIHIYYIIAYL